MPTDKQTVTIEFIPLKITNCLDCPNHKIVSDPDPHDWFCDDDTAVLCKISEPIDNSRFKNRAVTTACRPYNIRKESDIPTWCPLVNK